MYVFDQSVLDIMKQLGYMEDPICRMCKHHSTKGAYHITCNCSVAMLVKSVSKQMRESRPGFTGPLVPFVSIYVNEEEGAIKIPSVLFDEDNSKAGDCMWPEEFNPVLLKVCIFNDPE